MKYLTILLLVATSISGFAWDKKEKTESKFTTKIWSGKSKKARFFTPEASISMADGTQRRISDVQVGDQVVTYKNDQYIVTMVKEIAIYENPSSLLTTAYLRPAENGNTMVPALLLETSPHHKVLTANGKKRMKKVSKSDILYHYEIETGKRTTWKIGAVKTNAKRLTKAYDLKAEDGTFLVDHLMVSNN